MLNHIKHTARYQLSKFLQSDESFKLDLDGKDIALLVTIFDFMDAGKKELCFAQQEKISLISRVPRSTLIERIKKFIRLKLLEKKRSRYLNYYYIGEAIKSHVPLPDISSPTTGHQMSGNRTLYNNNNNNSYKKRISYKEKPKEELKCTVPVFGPGHPSWEAKRKWEKEK